MLGAGFGLTGFAHSTPAYAATVFVWTMGEIAFNAVGPTIVNSIAPAHLRGRYNGLVGLAYGAAALMGRTSARSVRADGSCGEAASSRRSVSRRRGLAAIGPMITQRMRSVDQPVPA